MPSESVKVIVRVRPMNEREKNKQSTNIVEADRSALQVTLTNPAESDTSKVFSYDAVFPMDSLQQTVYEDAAFQLVESVLEGYNGTIFAYGQTGCGKTHTMLGVPSDERLKGVIPRAFDHIFGNIESNTTQRNYLIRCSYIEIYNEEIHDLIGDDPKAKLDLKESPDKGVFIKGLTMHVMKSVPEIQNLMALGSKNRSVGETAMNKDSSRSHSIFTIYVEASETDAKGNQRITLGKLNLVDLAGSERQSKTQATGDRLKEANKINLSLSALGNVISALVDGKSSHIPYRDSKLTRLLQDSLGGNTKTVMIANVSPASDNYDETLGTLRYASRAKNIKNQPKVNEDPKDALLKEYADEIKRLKALLENPEALANYKAAPKNESSPTRTTGKQPDFVTVSKGKTGGNGQAAANRGKGENTQGTDDSSSNNNNYRGRDGSGKARVGAAGNGSGANRNNGNNGNNNDASFSNSGNYEYDYENDDNDNDYNNDGSSNNKGKNRGVGGNGNGVANGFGNGAVNGNGFANGNGNGTANGKGNGTANGSGFANGNGNGTANGNGFANGNGNGKGNGAANGNGFANGNGTTNGKGNGANGSGVANGNGNGTANGNGFANGNGNGTANGNGFANGNGNGKGNGAANGNGFANGNGTTNGKGNGAANGSGVANGNGNGSANGNGFVNGNGNGAVNGNGNGTANGNGVANGNGTANGNGFANGNGNGNGSVNGNGTANGKGNGAANGSGFANGNGTANGNGFANGNGNGAVNGNGNGFANGKGNGAANGNGFANGNGTANGKGNGAANGSGVANGNSNGTANGKGNGAANGNRAANGKGNVATNGNGNGNGVINGKRNGATNGNGNGKQGAKNNGSVGGANGVVISNSNQDLNASQEYDNDFDDDNDNDHDGYILKKSTTGRALETQLKAKEEEINDERKKREELENKLKELQLQFVVGGTHDKENKEPEEKKKYKAMAQKLKDQGQKQEELLKEKQKKEEEMLVAEKKYANLQEEVEEQRKIIKRLRKKYKEATGEIKDLEREHELNKEDLLDTIRLLERDIKINNSIMAYMLSADELEKIRAKAKWHDGRNEFVVPPFIIRAKKVNFPKIGQAQGLKMVEEEWDNREIDFQNQYGGDSGRYGDGYGEDQDWDDDQDQGYTRSNNKFDTTPVKKEKNLYANRERFASHSPLQTAEKNARNDYGSQQQGFYNPQNQVAMSKNVSSKEGFNATGTFRETVRGSGPNFNKFDGQLVPMKKNANKNVRLDPVNHDHLSMTPGKVGEQIEKTLKPVHGIGNYDIGNLPPMKGKAHLQPINYQAGNKNATAMKLSFKATLLINNDGTHSELQTMSSHVKGY